MITKGPIPSKRFPFEKPLVSVIVPNYNHSAYLRRRIDSILHQTYQNIEVILMDDFSSDDSREILRGYIGHPKISQLLENEENSGNTFLQWAKGVSCAKGEFIWIAESDDWAEPEFLENLVPLLDTDDFVEAAFCRSRKVDQNDSDLGLWNDHFTIQVSADQPIKYLASSSLVDLMLDGNCIPNASAVLFKRRVFSFVDDDVKSYRLNGDWIFWIKVIEFGRICYCLEPLNNFRSHSSNVRSQVEATGENLFEYLKVIKYLKSLRPSDERILKKASSILCDLHLRYARADVDQKVYDEALAVAAQIGVSRSRYSYAFLKCKLRTFYNEYCR